MSWIKVPKHDHGKYKALPVGAVSVARSRGSIVFGSASVAAWRLKRFKSANVYRNDTEEQIAVQFFDTDEGDYRACLNGNTMQVCPASLLRRMGIESARYLASRERDGFIVINFEVVVE